MISDVGVRIARFMEPLVSGMFRLGSARPPAALRAIERRCAGFIPIAVLLGLFASAFEGIGISMLMPLLGTISGSTGTAGLPSFAVRLRRMAEQVAPDHPILPLLGVVLVFVLLKAGTQIANATVISSIEERAGDDIRRALAERMLTLNYSFFLRQDPGRFITIIDTDSWKATEAVRVVLVGYSAKAAVILFAFLLVAIEWRLSLLVAVGVGLSRLAHRQLHRRLKRLSKAVVETNRILGEQMIHAVRATRVIRVFGQEQREAATFFGMSDDVRRAMFASDCMAAQSAPIVEIILATAILVVLFASNRLGIGVPYAATYLVLLYRAQVPVLNASNASLRLAALHASIAEVEWLLGAVPDVNVASVAAAAPPADVADQAIQFHRVGFEYPGNHEAGAPALKQIGMVLPPATIVALIGQSGSGKSTVINLLCRLLEPSSGVIKVGDCALSDIDPDQWRSLIGLAGQDTDLVTGTVAQNIAYGVPDADMAAIEASARLADADAFIRRLPQGYATPLGAIGFGLSGGQRQRIGVARAVLRRPEILILDEATSAVDHESEAKILQQLANQRPFGRAIVVSHDPRTLVHCEFGIVLSAGLVVEAGPIQQLHWYRETFPSGANQAVPGR